MCGRSTRGARMASAPSATSTVLQDIIGDNVCSASLHDEACAGLLASPTVDKGTVSPELQVVGLIC